MKNSIDEKIRNVIELLKKGYNLSKAYKEVDISEATVRRRRNDSKDIDNAIFNALNEGKDERERREKIVRNEKKRKDEQKKVIKSSFSDVIEATKENADELKMNEFLLALCETRDHQKAYKKCKITSYVVTNWLAANSTFAKAYRACIKQIAFVLTDVLIEIAYEGVEDKDRIKAVEVYSNLTKEPEPTVVNNTLIQTSSTPFFTSGGKIIDSDSETDSTR